MTDRVTLHIYSPAWGLPSFDRACLEMLTLCRINGFSIDVKESNNPFRTPEGRLPALYFGREGSPLTGFREVRSRLETLNFNSDYNLEEKQINERGLIENYVETALKPALEYLFWINPEVHGHVVRPLYSSKIPFPFGSYYLPKYHKEAIDYISVLYNVHHDDLEHGDSSVQTRANFKAQECLDFLTHRLAEKEFIFGKSPSSLDALVYSYLAPIAKIPLDSHPLGVYMKENCENLIKFVDRITTNYYHEIKSEYEKKKKEESLKQQSEMEILFYSKTNAFFSLCFASISMLGFAYHAGYFGR
uniref:Metaxin1like [Nasonia vitripennis] n=1 Tax=Lepeophtheirus salmonis TaxID=72036 RepID=A0A0K2TPW7_LEPSM